MAPINPVSTALNLLVSSGEASTVSLAEPLSRTAELQLGHRNGHLPEFTESV